MDINELIEIAKVTMIAWKSESEAEAFILGLHKNGYTEEEIENILYLMDDGKTATEAKKILGKK